MKKIRLIGLPTLVFYAATIVKTTAGEGVLSGDPLTPEGKFEYDPKTHLMTVTDGAILKYRDDQGNETILTANRVSYNELSGQTIAEGAVNLRREGQLWTCEHLEYNFYTKQIKTEAFRTGIGPFFASGAGLSLDQTNNTYIATNAVLTTDDAAEPSIKIRARQLKMVPGKSFEARDAVLYLGNVPVMYYPWYNRSLERHPNNFAFAPGYRSLYGPYLLGKYNWVWNEQIYGAINLDYYQRRGLGFGPDLHYDAGQFGQGSFHYYQIHDQKPGNDPAGNPIRDDRQRISFDHQVLLRTNLTAKVVVREQSDAYFIRDFFESEYRRSIQPSSFAEINQLWPNFSLNVLAQPRVNNFFETVERLPDVKLSAIRQQLGVSPFYYESDSSAGYFRYKFANNSSPEYAAFRADSFHQLVLPQTFFGWLNVTPRVGGRVTHYGETEGGTKVLAEQDRFVFNTGAEVSTKLSRVWPEAHSRLFEADGLRHILEPSVNYVYVPSPNRLPSQLPQFDSDLPTYSLPPIEFPDYNAIDSIDSQNVLRFGLHNTLQTKRKGEIDNLAHWALYTDWRLKPRADQSTFADLYSYLDLKPRSWFTLTSETRYDLQNERWRYANHYATVQPGSAWSVALGHRYLRDDPTLPAAYAGGNNLITSRIYFRFNENWALRISHHFEARDGTMEEQYYTLYRDLRSWTSALTVRLRSNRNGPSDFTVGVTFSLKSFPRFGLGTDRDTPSLLLGN